MFKTSQIVQHVSWLGGKAQSSPRRVYRCHCEVCGAVIEMRDSLTGDGFRMVPLGECPNVNDFQFGHGI